MLWLSNMKAAAVDGGSLLADLIWLIANWNELTVDWIQMGRAGVTFVVVLFAMMVVVHGYDFVLSVRGRMVRVNRPVLLLSAAAVGVPNLFGL